MVDPRRFLGSSQFISLVSQTMSRENMCQCHVSIDTGYYEGKYSIFCKAQSKENRELMF